MNTVLKIKGLFYKEISEGECIPSGYGLSYRRFEIRKTVCSPIPFNILIRALREFYYIMLCGLFKGKFEGLLIDAEQRGFTFACRAARETMERSTTKSGLVKYLYKIGYHSYDESNYVELCHNCKFTQQELTEMIAEAVVALKNIIVKEDHEYTKNFDSFMLGDGMKHNIIGWLIDNKGFEEVKYEQIWSMFGSFAIFDEKQFCGLSEYNDHPLVNAIKDLEKIKGV